MGGGGFDGDFYYIKCAVSPIWYFDDTISIKNPPQTYAFQEIHVVAELEPHGALQLFQGHFFYQEALADGYGHSNQLDVPSYRVRVASRSAFTQGGLKHGRRR